MTSLKLWMRNSNLNGKTSTGLQIQLGDCVQAHNSGSVLGTENRMKGQPHNRLVYPIASTDPRACVLQLRDAKIERYIGRL